MECMYVDIIFSSYSARYVDITSVIIIRGDLKTWLDKPLGKRGPGNLPVEGSGD